MELINTLWNTLQQWGLAPLFSIGETQVTLARLAGLAGLVFIVLFAWWASIALERGLRRMARHGNRTTLSDSGVYALTRITRYLAWIVGTLIGLTYIGFDLASLAIIGGAIGIGIGFGLQNIFSNFVSGIIILLEKTLKVGDFVDLQSGVLGRVTEISMRYTRVTTNDNLDVIVPNSEFINSRVTNWTLEDADRRIHVPFGVAYGTDKELVREAGIAAAQLIEGIIQSDERQPDVWLINFGASSLDFELVVWIGRELITSPGRTQARLLWAIESELKKRNIEIPFPQQDLHLRSGELTVHLEQEKASIKVGTPDSLHKNTEIPT